MARFDAAGVGRLLTDAGIVRSRGKIEAVIGSARAYLAMQAEVTRRAAADRVSNRTAAMAIGVKRVRAGKRLRELFP